jgi:hypothetical protein
VANRMCPQCGKVVPAACVMALSDGMICPHCQARLEVATGSRMLAATAGLIAGWLAWRLTRDSTNILGFALPVLFAILAFGIVSPLVLLLAAGLRLVPAATVFEPIAAAPGGHGQSAHGHTGGHH